MIICTILIIGSLIGSIFWVKSLIQNSYKEIGEIVEDKITEASNVPQVALDNYIGEIISSIKFEIKDIKIGKKVAEKIAEDLKTAILDKLGETEISQDILDNLGYLKSENKEDDNTTK